MEMDKKDPINGSPKIKKKKKSKIKPSAKALVPNPDISFNKDLEALGNIDPKSLLHLNTDDLRKKMLTGIYLLEHCLFSQAGFEFSRVQNIRTLLKTLEADIFKPGTLNTLTETEKLKLYKMCMNNMTSSLEFLSNLHKNVALGVEAVNNIDRLKADRGIGPVEDRSGNDAVSLVKQKILEAIAIKSKDKSPK